MNQHPIETQNPVQDESGQVVSEAGKTFPAGIGQEGKETILQAQETAARAVGASIGHMTNTPGSAPSNAPQDLQDHFAALVSRFGEIVGELQTLVQLHAQYLSEMADRENQG